MVSPLRRWLLLLVLLLVAAGLMSRAFYLQWMNREFLQGQGDARHLRVVDLAANRGVISDRNGEPLAISTPVDSVWVNPPLFLQHATTVEQLQPLAQLLKLDAEKMQQRIARDVKREFVYLRRHVDPQRAAQVMALNLPGVSLQREYRRYYPMGEVTGHVVGFTNIDDVGQEGVELAYESRLQGKKGSKRVLKDRLGRVVEDVENIAPPQPGESLHLSIDRRLQYLAYRELKAVVKTYGARSASAVILDATSGEVLAMVTQPTFNPNDRTTLRSNHYRNRALADLFEPGSTIKPFTVAAALEAGIVTPSSVIDTAPGRFRVGSHVVRDGGDYGAIDIATILRKSSNIGASKLALELSGKQLWRMFDRVGFGIASGSPFASEADGHLGDYWRWKDTQKTTLSYGYGMSVTALQLARAYAVLAADGVLKPVSFLKLDAPSEGVQVISVEVASQVRGMLETVVTEGGTGTAAQVSGYRVAGKTGTVHKSSKGGYAEDRYSALFAGMAPASSPRLVMVVMVDEPQRGGYHGGAVAAPVFARVMSGALRLLGVAPDDLPPPALELPERHADIDALQLALEGRL